MAPQHHGSVYVLANEPEKIRTPRSFCCALNSYYAKNNLIRIKMTFMGGLIRTYNDITTRVDGLAGDAFCLMLACR